MTVGFAPLPKQASKQRVVHTLTVNAYTLTRTLRRHNLCVNPAPRGSRCYDNVKMIRLDNVAKLTERRSSGCGHCMKSDVVEQLHCEKPGISNANTRNKPSLHVKSQSKKRVSKLLH